MIAAKAEYEYLCDKPYQDNRKVRVAGPFTVESLSPFRVPWCRRERRADRPVGRGAGEVTAADPHDVHRSGILPYLGELHLSVSSG